MLNTSLVILVAFAAPPDTSPAGAAFAFERHRLQLPAVQYGSARDEAVTTGQPLVVGVGCEPPAGAWLTVRWDGFPTSEGKPCLIVAQPRGGDLIWLSTLPAAQSSDVSRILSASGQAAGGVRAWGVPSVVGVGETRWQPPPAAWQPTFGRGGYCPPGGT